MRRAASDWSMPLLAALAGAASLAVFSLLQKRILGVPAELMLAPRSFLVPLLFGGGSGAALGLVFRRLRQSEERYRTVAEQATEMIFWRTASGDLRYVSPSALQLTGWTPEELMADPALMERMVHDEDHAACLAHRHGARHQGDLQGLEFRIVRRDGTLRWISHVCRAVTGPVGEDLGVRGAHTDITDRKRLEQQVQQSQRAEILGQLAGGVAHDLRNLLTGVLGPASIIEAESSDPAARDHAREILEAGRRASTLARDLLDVARREPLQLRPARLEEVVRGADRLLQRVAGAGVQVEVRHDGAPLPVVVDARRLEQVLLNLVVNAREAMPGGGAVTIGLSLGQAEGGAGPAMARLTVSDTGCGMEPATCQRIFEPFFTTRPAGQGTGLGLAVVQRILEEHRARIAVESTPGRGTTFTIWLPVQPA